MCMNVHLHLGFHKTGTTFVQDSLKKSSDDLLKEGLFYIPLNRLRLNFSNRLGKDETLPYEQQALLDSFIDRMLVDAEKENSKLIVFSDENIIGFPAQITNALYWTAPNRVRRLRSLFADKLKVKRITLSVREYSSFYQSLFIEANKRKFIPTAKVNKSKLMDFSFIDIVRLLQKVFPDSQIELVSFEDFVVDNSQLFNSITGLNNTKNIKFSDNKRVSPSNLAYIDSEIIQNISSLSSDTKDYLHHELMQATHYAKSSKNLLFNEHDIKLLKARYIQELANLKKEGLLICGDNE